MKKIFFISAFTALTISATYTQGSLKADYYNGINFEEHVGTQFISELDFYWDKKAPIEGLEPDNCSVLYTGQLKTPKTGTVTFSARVDDGIMVWINDELIISNWQLNDVGISEGKIYLEANKNYDLKIKYFNAMNEAELKLLWTLPLEENRSWFSKFWYGDGDSVTIPSKFLMPPVEKKKEKINRA